VPGRLRACHARRRRRARSSTSPSRRITECPPWRTRARPGAAVEAITRELASLYGPRGIAVVAVALGRFDTESLRTYPAELWKRGAAGVPVQRLESVEEHGWLIALLATPLGASLSGSVVTLDGALDNWTGPWPPTGLTRDGEVPTEERRSVA